MSPEIEKGKGNFISSTIGKKSLCEGRTYSLMEEKQGTMILREGKKVDIQREDD